MARESETGTPRDVMIRIWGVTLRLYICICALVIKGENVPLTFSGMGDELIIGRLVHLTQQPGALRETVRVRGHPNQSVHNQSSWFTAAGAPAPCL